MVTKVSQYRILYLIVVGTLSVSCGLNLSPEETLEVITYAQFEKFVSETEYVTDAEKFGWSVVQQDVYNFITVKNANWRKPDGTNPAASPNLPVTQVSYNDALAYCEWAEAKLPTYGQYWDLIEDDSRKVISNNNGPISAASEVNTLGNVWEITASERGEEIQLAGGSLFCTPTSCHGTSRNRSLYVDKQTGNIHIGFAVIRKANEFLIFQHTTRHFYIRGSTTAHPFADNQELKPTEP